MVRGSGLQGWDEFKCLLWSECGSENMLVVCIYVKKWERKVQENNGYYWHRVMRSGGASERWVWNLYEKKTNKKIEMKGEECCEGR